MQLKVKYITQGQNKVPFSNSSRKGVEGGGSISVVYCWNKVFCIELYYTINSNKPGLRKNNRHQISGIRNLNQSW